jgi:membrane protease YdiL (CAAX protease family)
MSIVPDREGTKRASLREPLLAYLSVIALAAILYWTAQWLSFLQQFIHGAIACAFLFGPQVAARFSGRPFHPQVAGITVHPIGSGVRVLALALVTTWPAFVIGFFLYYGALCPREGALHTWSAVMGSACLHWRGFGNAHWQLPDGFFLLALSQILVVALPEELFFRAYLLSRLEERWPSRHQFLGAAVGWPLVVCSLLFGLGHFLVDFQPTRLAVVFPALAFGWMRSRSGSIAPGAIFHALCNLLSEVLHESYF